MIFGPIMLIVPLVALALNLSFDNRNSCTLVITNVNFLLHWYLC